MTNLAPEPNFARLVTEQDLQTLTISAHALRRFVERLQPGIPGAALIVVAHPARTATCNPRTRTWLSQTWA